MAVILLLILLYVCFNMLFYIFRVEAVKRIMLAASLILLVVSSAYVNTLFLYFVPVNGAELVSRYTPSLKYCAFPAAFALVMVKVVDMPEYILTGVFSLTIFFLSRKVYLRITALLQETDKLREKADTLHQRLDQEEDYEAQIRYLSQMEERNKLAQKIHDKVGHAIAGSLIQLEAASLIIDSDREKSREILNNVINVLKEGMENIRSTLRNIKPAPEQLGINRLKAVLDEYSLKNHITTSLSYNGNISIITHLHWKIIMDNVREALTNSPPGRIMDAIKIVFDGGTVMQDVVMDKIKEGLSEGKKGKISEEMFTEREMDIIRLISKGYSNKDIAGELFMSEGTVKNYITSILDKTGLEQRTQTAIYYLTGNK